MPNATAPTGSKQTDPAGPPRGPVGRFLVEHYRHFNAREAVAAAQGWVDHLDAGGEMLVTLAGAMSTAEIGRILSRAIRGGKVHAICCTGANLEEDVFNLLAGEEYEHVPHWRALTAEDEAALLERGMNRVTDTCIPETVMRHLERRLIAVWDRLRDTGERMYPHELFWAVLDEPDLAEHYQRPAEHSWMLAAKERNIPVFTPGWEDSTLGNIFTAWAMRNELDHHAPIRFGTEAMARLAHWYRGHCHLDKDGPSVGFFQVGGGIAGDFPICTVPMMVQDLHMDDTPTWGYFAQISDAVTSYGGYSGAVPNEKITWGKLAVDTPKFMIQSDASIVFPLVLAYVLGD